MGRTTCPPSGVSGPFVRFHYTVCLTLYGKGSAVLGKDRWILTAGQGILIPPDVTASFSTEGDALWEYLLVGFSGNQALALLNAAGLVPGSLLSCWDQKKMEETVQSIGASSKSSFDQVLLRQALLCSFLSLLTPASPIPPQERCLREEEAASLQKNVKKNAGVSFPHITAVKGDRPLQHMEKALEYVSLHYASPLSVTEMAASLGISRNYLFTLFQKNLGCSPFEYITDFRLSRGKDLLRQTDYSVGSIAYSCGYEDPAVFSRAFKKKYGISPSESRR